MFLSLASGCLNSQHASSVGSGVCGHLTRISTELLGGWRPCTSSFPCQYFCEVVIDQVSIIHRLSWKKNLLPLDILAKFFQTLFIKLPKVYLLRDAAAHRAFCSSGLTSGAYSSQQNSHSKQTIQRTKSDRKNPLLFPQLVKGGSCRNAIKSNH